MFQGSSARKFAQNACVFIVNQLPQVQSVSFSLAKNREPSAQRGIIGNNLKLGYFRTILSMCG